MPPRKPKSPFGFTRPFDFKISDADWEKLQTAYGRKIPDKERGEIITATKRMLSQSAAEHSLRPLSEGIKHITRLKKATNKLLAAFTASGLPSTSIHFAEAAIDQELSDVTDDITFDEFHDHLMLFAGACTRAPARAALVAVHTGEARNAWIKDLTDICHRNKWPTAARKDPDKNKTGRPSPFVSFVYELQQLIPSEHRHGRSKQSPDALAKEIKQAQNSGPERARRSKK
jgi:hypothetical protein